MEFLDTFHHLGQQGIDVDKALLVGGALFRNFKDLGFRIVQEGFGIPAHGVQGVGSDFVPGAHQLAQDGPLPNNFRIAADIGSGRGIGGQFPQIGQAAAVFPVPCRIQGFRHGHHVRRFARGKEPDNLAEDAPVFVPVKIPFVNQVPHLVPGLVVQQQAA